jgi:hypothetical protein
MQPPRAFGRRGPEDPGRSNYRGPGEIGWLAASRSSKTCSRRHNRLSLITPPAHPATAEPSPALKGLHRAQGHASRSRSRRADSSLRRHKVPAGRLRRQRRHLVGFPVGPERIQKRVGGVGHNVKRARRDRRRSTEGGDAKGGRAEPDRLPEEFVHQYSGALMRTNSESNTFHGGGAH